MKIVTLVARILLGLMFVVFGLNGFLHFIPQPPAPPGLARDYFMVMFSSHYMVIPFALQLAGGLLLLANRYVPVALVLLGPVIVNILMFHILMLPSGIAPGLIATILFAIVAYNVRSAFTGILQPRSAG